MVCTECRLVAHGFHHGSAVSVVLYPRGQLEWQLLTPLPDRGPGVARHRVSTPESAKFRVNEKFVAVRFRPNPHRTRTQIRTQTLWCCLCAVWTLPFTNIGSICFALRCASCADEALSGLNKARESNRTASESAVGLVPGVASWKGQPCSRHIVQMLETWNELAHKLCFHLLGRVTRAFDDVWTYPCCLWVFAVNQLRTFLCKGMSL